MAAGDATLNTSVELKTYVVAERLGGEPEIFHYLDAAFEDLDPAIISSALADVARARGMTSDRQRGRNHPCGPLPCASR
ncbi:probable addiction module antidote protein [Sphingopyxis flava]|uniref:Probable addiction module antidote protein n=1 Tax=Sphingopyxis flava TaxID=1507287 RepID=A0A1T5D7H3_9SPHN|nr:probable addiction module antidote protein [Sphingopyxis flava]